MKTIKITKGTFGHRPEGARLVVLKDTDSEPFEVDDAVADKMVSLGVAQIVDSDDVVTAYDEGMTKKQLVEVGATLGLALNDKMTKQALIAALDAAANKTDEEDPGDPEANEDDDGEDGSEIADDGEEPPAVNAADPE